jgi:hypothetical protein
MATHFDDSAENRAALSPSDGATEHSPRLFGHP